MKDAIREKVQSLVEQRVMQAMKKQITKKLFCIAKWLGRPIIAQTLFQSAIDDPRYEDDMIYDPPMMTFSNDRTYEATEWESNERGFHFEALKYGINLCATAMVYDNKLDELKTTYNGYLVYAEIEGELKAYAPFPAWENAVEMFYEAALDIEKKRTSEERLIKQEKNKEKVKTFWDNFKKLWGY